MPCDERSCFYNSTVSTAPTLSTAPAALPIRLAGLGKWLPPWRVHASEIDQRIQQAPGWTMKHTGVEWRHFVRDETTAQMAAAAAREALAEAGLSQPDLLLSASGTQQQPIPCTAALVAKELGWSSLACMDINATCLGFIAALQTAAALITTGTYSSILVVCSDIASRGLNWRSPESAALFGDGAAAAVLTHAGATASALLHTRMETWPEGSHLTEIRGGGTTLPAALHRPGENTEDYLFHMDGPGIFRMAAQRMEPFVAQFVGTAEDRWENVQAVIPHQASLAAMQLLRRRLGIPEAKCIEIVRDHGNCIAASMPHALHSTVRSGQLQRGDTALLLGTSAGFSLGGALLRY